MDQFHSINNMHLSLAINNFNNSRITARLFNNQTSFSNSPKLTILHTMLVKSGNPLYSHRHRSPEACRATVLEVEPCGRQIHLVLRPRTSWLLTLQRWSLSVLFWLQLNYQRKRRRRRRRQRSPSLPKHYHQSNSRKSRPSPNLPV